VVAATAAISAAVLRAHFRTDLRGKVVLITGGSRGLGLALAREFAARGCHLILCARNWEDLARAKHDLDGHDVRVVTLVCDIRDQKQVNEAISQALAEFGRIDILVNNAGTIRVGPIRTMTIEDFEQAMDVMFWGMVYMTLAVLPHFEQRGFGNIVNITSIGGKVSVPHLVPYSCAKFAAVAFSEGLRTELNDSGVKVVTIAPGLMRTGSFLNAFFKGAERQPSRDFDERQAGGAANCAGDGAGQGIANPQHPGQHNGAVSWTVSGILRWRTEPGEPCAA
jgi:NAD(P)-dependent dehydrogenase (short-subunit alcohol dehydrogenase family)